MATSASIDFSLTARQVIDYALQKINIVPRGQAASAEVADGALRELEMMLKEWMKHENIWRIQEGYVALTAATGGYTLTPAPYRIVDVRYRNANGTDLPLTLLTRQEYYDLPNKSSAGVPTAWFFDPLRASQIIYVWPLLASVTTETLRLTYQRRIEDIDDLSNEIDVPQEHLSVAGYNLAARIADDYGRSGPHIDRIVARAENLLQELLDQDRPEVIRFVPETRYG